MNYIVAKHNHPPHLVETTHMLASQIIVSQVQTYEINMAANSGIKQNASFELKSTQVGGRTNLGDTSLYQKKFTFGLKG